MRTSSNTVGARASRSCNSPSYCALAERFGSDWRKWPAEYQRPTGACRLRFRGANMPRNSAFTSGSNGNSIANSRVRAGRCRWCTTCRSASIPAGRTRGRGRTCWPRAASSGAAGRLQPARTELATAGVCAVEALRRRLRAVRFRPFAPRCGTPPDCGSITSWGCFASSGSPRAPSRLGRVRPLSGRRFAGHRRLGESSCGGVYHRRGPGHGRARRPPAARRAANPLLPPALVRAGEAGRVSAADHGRRDDPRPADGGRLVDGLRTWRRSRRPGWRPRTR